MWSNLFYKLKYDFFREIDGGYIVKYKQIMNFTSFSKSQGKSRKIKMGEFMNNFRDLHQCANGTKVRPTQD